MVLFPHSINMDLHIRKQEGKEGAPEDLLGLSFSSHRNRLENLREEFFYAGKMPDWLNQNEPPSINLRSSSGFQWGQWAGDGESPGPALLEPQFHEITGCWSPLSLSDCVTAGTQQADVIHTGPSLWLGCWGCTAMLCSQEFVMGSGTLQLQNLWFYKYLDPPKQHPITNWDTRGRYSKKAFKTLTGGEEKLKGNNFGCLYQFNLPSIPFCSLVLFSFLLPGCHPAFKLLGDPWVPKGDKSWKSPIIHLQKSLLSIWFLFQFSFLEIN